MFSSDVGTGSVGAILPCAHVKLRDIPEMDYMAANGEGEVCFKGPCMTQGYFKNPEKTAELFDEEGYVKTGDVGKWLPNGTLQIIDRVKHIFKLSQVRNTTIILFFYYQECIIRSGVYVINLAKN